MNATAYVKEIYFYPVKSLAGVKLDKCLLTKYGIAHPDVPQVIDRNWMVIDHDGNFQTQRRLPRMSLIHPKISKDFLILTANGKQDCKVPIKPTTNLINCRLSEFLEKDDLDLVSFGTGCEPRKSLKIDENNNRARDYDEVIFHDYSPFMLISEMSLNDLNSRLKEPVIIRNFRPNFFVSGCEAYSEDNWESFTIGNTRFLKIKHCTRCLLTTVNPNTGEKNKEMEPLNTLKGYRMMKEIYAFSPIFGINITLENNELHNNTISVGDSIILN